ncbi:MAG TPA: co-chaperone GroES [Candidatus Babeliales bacterium]|nr:co-chaperone GroES [Candidatus Babeliales bacterium]
MFDQFRPLGDKVLVKRIEQEEKTAFGIIIPDAAKEKAQTGVVLAVGPGRFNGTTVVPMNVAIGDKVYFGKYSGTEADRDHLIIKEDDILGIIKQS